MAAETHVRVLAAYKGSASAVKLCFFSFYYFFVSFSLSHSLSLVLFIPRQQSYARRPAILVVVLVEMDVQQPRRGSVCCRFLFSVCRLFSSFSSPSRMTGILSFGQRALAASTCLSLDPLDISCRRGSD